MINACICLSEAVQCSMMLNSRSCLLSSAQRNRRLPRGHRPKSQREGTARSSTNHPPRIIDGRIIIFAPSFRKFEQNLPQTLQFSPSLLFFSSPSSRTSAWRLHNLLSIRHDEDVRRYFLPRRLPRLDFRSENRGCGGGWGFDFEVREGIPVVNRSFTLFHEQDEFHIRVTHCCECCKWIKCRLDVIRVKMMVENTKLYLAPLCDLDLT